MRSSSKRFKWIVACSATLGLVLSIGLSRSSTPEVSVADIATAPPPEQIGASTASFRGAHASSHAPLPMPFDSDKVDLATGDISQSPAQELISAFEQEGLSFVRLRDLYHEKGEEAFLAALPEKSRQAFERLMDLVRKKRVAILGVSEPQNQLHATTTKISQQYLYNRRAWLDGVSLPTRAQTLVARVLENRVIHDQDLKDLLSACELRSECIEKSVVLLMDGRHQLTTRQFQIIRLAMKEN